MKYKAPVFMTLFISLSAFSQKAEFPECGADWNCYYNRKAELLQQDRQRQQEELESYRNQQLQLQQEQLEEMQTFNDQMEQQLQEINERQGTLEEQQQDLLKELKALREEAKEKPKQEQPATKKVTP